MVEFSSIEDIQNTLNIMINREMPLVILIPTGAGRREERYANTLCGEVKMEEVEKETLIATLPSMDKDRLDAIEARLSVIEEKLGIS